MEYLVNLRIIYSMNNYLGIKHHFPCMRIYLRICEQTGEEPEAIEETDETETETLAAWMETPTTRAVILEQRASEMGFAWFQEPNGKIWWTLVTAKPAEAAPLSDEELSSLLEDPDSN